MIKNQDNPIKVYGPSTSRSNCIIALGILMILPIFLLIYPSDTMSFSKMVASSVLMVLGIYLINYATRNRISGLPQITIYQTGIKLKSRKVDSFFRWQDIGPFTTKFGGGGTFISHVFAYYFKD